MDALVICIGNKARGDDGAARRVAELLEGKLPAGVTLVSKPQLDIVMAEEVAATPLVIFCDAERRDDPAVVVTEVTMGTARADAHAIDPWGLVALAATLYGPCEDVRLVSVAGPEMDHGEGLSATAKAASEEAAFTILTLLGEA